MKEKGDKSGGPTDEEEKGRENGKEKMEFGEMAEV